MPAAAEEEEETAVPSDAISSVNRAGRKEMT